MHFCKIYKIQNYLALILNGTEITIIHQHKILAITLYSKLSFIPHIKQIRIKCNRTIQFLWAIAHTDESADKKTLNKLYWSLIQSKLDYDYFIYKVAWNFYFQELDSIHHQWLCIAFGAFTTSPIESLYIEANELPLSLWRQTYTLILYWTQFMPSKACL